MTRKTYNPKPEIVMYLSIRKIFILLALLLSMSLFASNKHSKKSNYMSYKGLVMAGYQGWFNAPDDGVNRGWNHYRKGDLFEPGHCSIDMWPDMSEYDKKYKTSFFHADGTPAYVFSSYDKSTVDLHFKWMKQYGIDGVFMQRFVQTLKNRLGAIHSNQVLQNAIEAAGKYDRTLCIMYDLSGMSPENADIVIQDWKRIVDEYKLTSRKKNQYLYHNNKPLVAIWGIGFADRKYGYPEYEKLIKFFKNDPDYGGCSLLLGVPSFWRELGSDTDKNPQLHEIIKQADIIHPWSVGRFSEATYPKFHDVISKDIAWCKKEGKDYVPVIFPGFSWHNLKNEATFNQNPRNGGRFFWAQIAKSIELGAEMIYFAMFDEMDEGTAIFKVSNNPPVGQSPFLDIDGFPSDYYLWLAGEGGRMMRKERPLSISLPHRGDEGRTP